MIEIKPTQLWTLLFAAWCIFLSGWVRSPGVTQLVRLKHLMAQKNGELASLSAEVDRLRGDSVKLDQNRFTQEREIRRVLGYTASDEWVFDFNSVPPPPPVPALTDPKTAPADGSRVGGAGKFSPAPIPNSHPVLSRLAFFYR